jgi:trk system potassium uptake protein TrkH
MVLFTVGRVCRAEGIILLIPAIVSVIYKEDGWKWFLLTAAIAAAFGTLLTLCRPRTRDIYVREGLVITGLSWTLVSVIGALPFFFSGEIQGYINCLFETCSGFSTTGSTIVSSPESLSMGIGFWRCFIQWLGGMGVLVLLLTVLPLGNERSMHIMRAEAPGPMVGKLVPKMSDTAKILYAIYIGLTVIEAILLKCGGLTYYDSIVHAFTTAATGGFSTHSASIAYFDSKYVEIIVTVFMFLFGINFNMYFLLLCGKFRDVFKNSELRVYLAVVFGGMVVIALNIMKIYGGFFPALRQSSFHVATLMSTTGYGTADFDTWPAFSKAIMLLMLIVGASAGSTGGGIKFQRVMIWVKKIVSDLRQIFRPRAVTTVRMDGKRVPDAAVQSASNYFALYFFISALFTLIISIDGFSLETNLTAVMTCLSNVGPGFGGVGPTHTFEAFSGVSKLILSAAMLLGRLELFPMLALLDFRKLFTNR